MKLTFVVVVPGSSDEALVLAGRVSVYIDEALHGTEARWELVKVESGDG